MKLIGITGKSGAGKSTLSNMLGEYPKVAIIHIDDLINIEKQEKIPYMMDKDTAGRPIVLKNNLNKFFNSNKILFRMLMGVKSQLVHRKISRKIEEYREQGYEAVVIECVYLKYFKFFEKLDVRVLVKRPYEQRLASVLIRDRYVGINKEKFVLRDIPYKRGYYKEDRNKYKYIIQNTTLEELRSKAQEIYDREIKVPNIMDQYKVEPQNKENTPQKDMVVEPRGKDSKKDEKEPEI